MVKPSEPWSKHAGSHGQTLVPARLAPNSGSLRSPAEFGSCRWKSVIAGLNSAIPADFPRIPAPESVLGNRETGLRQPRSEAHGSPEFIRQTKQPRNLWFACARR